ncbi:Rrp15p-domain-containing protein [Polyplosphaeria fusca]|uniref:Rrp15p-domain-containing protein n=1 Tax=Polyplosphaeria fusca TaxID=682080 RepID=A0A9P4V073_9PLEO|nr:Rrp15p-domain-containing protein [Polyplosphaeria fusca]
MPPSTTLKRRRTEEGMRGRVPKKEKKFKRQRYYHSSSEDDDEEAGARDAPQEFTPVNLQSSDEEERAEKSKAKSKPKPKFTAKIATKKAPSKPPIDQDVAEDDEDEEGEGSEQDGDRPAADSDVSSLSDTSTNNPRRVKKRNDPEAFATSMSKILNSKLTSQKRSEPILSRSKSAQETNKSLSDHKLTLKAHKKLLEDKRAAQEKGRVKDVLGAGEVDVSTAIIVAEEKKLRRTAQKGVIKLFNAVRAAQVKAEQAEKEARQKGVVGMGAREEKVKEMSKQGFLDMIAGGGKKEGSVEV